MQVTMELLLTELGISAQPLQESFVRYGKWITGTWLKSVWEKVDKFQITVKIAPLPVCPPREGTSGSCKQQWRQVSPTLMNKGY